MVYLKRGDTLLLLIKRKSETGEPLTGQTAFLTSQIRDSVDNLIAQFAIEETDELGTYLFTITNAETANFPLGTLYFDIQYNDGSITDSTETLMLIVKKDVTV